MSTIQSIEQLEALYGQPSEVSTVKETDHITPQYRALIEASPFVALATSGAGGLDCSPRGDAPGFVRVHDEKTLMLPDRKGNNRVDSLRNIVHDARTGLLFMIPGVGITLRVNGRAQISIDPELLASFVMEDKLPRSVIVLGVEAVYFQCGRALIRSGLWNPEKFVAPQALPGMGEILAEITENRLGGKDFDREWQERAKKTLW